MNFIRVSEVFSVVLLVEIGRFNAVFSQGEITADLESVASATQVRINPIHTIRSTWIFQFHIST